MRSSNGVGPGLADTSEANLTLLDKLRYRTEGFLDWNPPVNTVLVVEVDGLDAEAYQARLTGFDYLLWSPISAKTFTILASFITKFATQDYLVASPFNRLPDDSLVMPVAVGIRGVEQADPCINGMMQGFYRILIVGRPVS
jgi:hypothetical protein